MKILIAGEGGQGVQALAKILSNSGYKQNLNTCYIPHYGVEMRMGISFAYIQIGLDPIAYPKFRKADILAIMTEREFDISAGFNSQNTKLINAIELSNNLKNFKISNKALNMLVLGIIVKELKNAGIVLKPNIISDEIKSLFKDKTEFINENINAFNVGLSLDDKQYLIKIDKIKSKEFKPKIDSDNRKSHIKYPGLCKGCGLCLEKCPVNAMTWNQDLLGYIGRPIPLVDINKCTACMNCQNICPDSAISIIKNI